MFSVTEKLRTVKSRVRKTVKRDGKVTRTERVHVEKTRTRRTVKAAGKPNGLILYRGPSLLDGKPIVVVAIGFARKSKNLKTGNMLGTYILADNGEDPIQALK